MVIFECGRVFFLEIPVFGNFKTFSNKTIKIAFGWFKIQTSNNSEFSGIGTFCVEPIGSKPVELDLLLRGDVVEDVEEHVRALEHHGPGAFRVCAER